MAHTKPIITIQNVVASMDMKQSINLDKINEIFPNTEYHPKTFPGLFFRLKDPKTVTLIFHSGKMVCTGAKSEDMIGTAVSMVIKELISKKMIVKKDPNIIIQNIVASVNLYGLIHLENVARTLPHCLYEPEQFPGVMYRISNPKSVIQMFASGKIVCTGTKNEDDLFRSVNNLHSDLEMKHLIDYETYDRQITC